MLRLALAFTGPQCWAIDRFPTLACIFRGIWPLGRDMRTGVSRHSQRDLYHFEENITKHKVLPVTNWFQEDPEEKRAMTKEGTGDGRIKRDWKRNACKYYATVKAIGKGGPTREHDHDASK